MVYVEMDFFICFSRHNKHARNGLFPEREQITISMKKAYLKDILWAIQQQTTFVFMYHEEDLDKVGKVNVEARASTVEKILSTCLKGTGLTYVFQNEVIVLKPLNDEKKKEIRIVGKVMDRGKMPLPGVDEY